MRRPRRPDRALSQEVGETMNLTLAGRPVQIEGVTPASLAALRLVQYHAPNMIVTVITEQGTQQAKLKDIDLAPSFKQSEPVNHDRAQLAKLGG
jgi:hypothetical protein